MNDDAPTPWVDPQMRRVLDRMLEKMAARPLFGTSPPAVMRARFAEDVLAWNVDPPALPRIEDFRVATGTREVAVRLYDPRGDGRPNATMIDFHGGGWIVGDLDTNDRARRLLALESGVSILSVDYCLAPEHPFPAALEECVTVTRWAHRSGVARGIDVERLALGGDSAGANLALATALELRDARQDWLRFLLLIYGAYARDATSESHRLYGGGEYGFGTQAMDLMWQMYLGSRGAADDPRAAPLLARLEGLPPACLIAGRLDPLRDDSRRMAAALIAAGISVEYLEYPGVVHGFMSMTHELDAARRGTRAAADALRRALTGPTAAVDSTARRP
ncbi:MAG: alpha/beta hydrolase [Gammaproteobacteria bacterium]|nr:alpha/beta hydrolase [Gammaproteobacteria bacterium]